MSTGTPRRWALYACRTPYAVEVAEVIWRRDEEVALLVDNMPAAGGAPAAGEEIGAQVVPADDLSEEHARLDVVVPLITPGHRFAVEEEARVRGLSSFPALLDPTATVARTAEVGEGAVVNAASVIAAKAAIGRFAHLNRGASVGHHNSIGDFATLGPGCVLAGGVRVGRGAFLGAGATCAPEVSIGANAVVGAGAVVVGDVPPGATVVGNPARVIREGGTGYNGVAVPEGAS